MELRKFFLALMSVGAATGSADAQPWLFTVADEEPAQGALDRPAGTQDTLQIPPQPATEVTPQPSGSAAYTGWLPPQLRGESIFKAELSAGLRYDSDANQAAETSVPGQTAQTLTALTPKKQADWSFVTKGGFTHEYIPSSWRDTAWDTNFEVSDQRFFHISHNYDLTVAQIDTGPRISIPFNKDAKFAIRPFGSYAWIGYGDETYASLYGGGLSADVRAPRWGASLIGTGRFGNYENSSFRPSSRSYTGPEWLISIATTVLLNTTTTLTSSFSWYQAVGQTTDFNRQGPVGLISLDKQIMIMSRPADMIVRGSVQRLLYGGPPPGHESSDARYDTDWIGDLLLSIPVFRSVSATGLRSMKVDLEYQYLRNVSNYSPFENHAFTVGFRLGL